MILILVPVPLPPCAFPPVCVFACSFGVVLLELLTGRVPVDDNGTLLVHWVSNSLLLIGECMGTALGRFQAVV